MIIQRKYLSTCFRFLVDRPRHLTHEIRQTLTRRQCYFCGLPTWETAGVCSPCSRDLPYIETCCYACALPISNSNDSLFCLSCKCRHPSFDTAIACFRYTFPVRNAIQELKYKQRWATANTLVNLSLEAIENHYQNDDWPVLLIPVPMDKRKYRLRRANHAEVITRRLSAEFGISYNRKTLVKTQSTCSQVGLKREERLRNLKGAFSISKPLEADHVALVDDVMTTGATVEHLAKLLKSNGVRRVDVWTIARTPKAD